MARITVAEAQAWAEGTKFTIQDPFTAQNESLLTQLEEEVISRIASAYPVDYLTWVDATTTPKLVRTAISKIFVAWAYRRQYSESMIEDDAAYANLLEANAEVIIQGIVDGTIDIPAVTSSVGPAFYPTDASSIMEPTPDDPSLGPAKFSMGMVFFYPGEKGLVI